MLRPRGELEGTLEVVVVIIVLAQAQVFLEGVSILVHSSFLREASVKEVV